MMRALFATVALCVGFLMGAVTMHDIDGRSTARAITLLKLGERQRLEQRAKRAYEQQKFTIAAWEYQNLIPVLEEHLTNELDSPKLLKLQLFLAHARLYKALNESKTDQDASKHLDFAVRFYNELYPKNAITNGETLERRLIEFDRSAGLQQKTGEP